MASNILSRLLPSTSDEGKNLQHRPSFDQNSDLEDPTMALDEENMGTRFQEQDLEQLLADAATSEMANESTVFSASGRTSQKSAGKEKAGMRPKWMRGSPTSVPLIEEDDDVPESLLLEKKERPARKKDRNRRKQNLPEELPTPIPGPSTQSAKAQWEATRAQQRLHRDGVSSTTQRNPPRRGVNGPLIGDPKERALWRWANVDHLDGFLADVYRYYYGHGFWSIVLFKVLWFLSLLFLVGFSTFMLFCIDYSKLSHSTRLEEVRVPKCTKNLPVYWNFFLFIIVTSLVLNIIAAVRTVPSLWEMRNFYHYLLNIPDRDIQTISWQYVVSRLMALRDANVTTAQDLSPEHRRFLNGQSKQRMDAHDIANRLMRKENYYIAMVNKDVLDCGINIPFLGKRQFFTRTVEWNLHLAITDFVFDQQNQIKSHFITSRNRRENINTLRLRFYYVAVINIFCAPFLVAYFVLSQFFSNFTVCN